MDNLHCGSCAELLGNASQAARHLSMVEVHHWAWAVENCPLFVFSSSLFPKYYELGSNKMLLWILTLAIAPNGMAASGGLRKSVFPVTPSQVSEQICV